MRIAVFFTPPADHPLVKVAANWLGRDAFSGDVRTREPVEGFEPAEIDALTADPRRYGFHATLKPPFRIAEDHGIDAVKDAISAFCRDRPAGAIPALRLAEIGPFFALTADGGSEAVDRLADDVIRAFEPFRAPLSEADVARRRPDRLSLRQRKNLRDWGYPYIFDDFRFHMTLTGQVPEARRDAMRSVLQARFARFIGEPLPVDGIALFREPSPPCDFIVDTRVAFEAAPQPMVGT